VYASARLGQELLCLFADPDFQEQDPDFQAFHGASKAKPGFALVQVKMQIPTIACVSHLIPQGLG